jgi:hypothetical protein
MRTDKLSINSELVRMIDEDVVLFIIFRNIYTGAAESHENLFLNILLQNWDMSRGLAPLNIYVW